MDVRCDKCSTEYEFDENRVGANGVTVKCTACGFVFKVHKARATPPNRATTTLGKGPQGREWLVRKLDGQMIAFRELTTLQKWIVEGRITRDDEISKNGETWKRLGNILELEPFFSVYEKARALNELIEKGGVDAQRVELRGSEVLATMNPVSTLGSDSASASPAIGPQYGHASSVNATERTPSAVRSKPVGIGRVNGGSSSRGVGLDAPPLLGLEGSGLADTAPSRPMLPSEPSRRPEAWARMPSALDADLDRGEHLPGGDLRGDSDSGRAEGGSKLRPLFFAVLFVILVGLGGGAALAMFGPKGNPVQRLAERYGVLSARTDDDISNRIIEDAHRAFDLDALTSLERAEAMLEEAEKTKPHDPRIQGDRALVMMTRADALRREASDLGLQAELITTQTPSVAVALREQVDRRSQEASALVKRGFEVAAAAYKSAPEAFEPARALAEYYRVQQDYESYNRELARAKRVTERSGRADAALLYIEGAALARAPRADAEAIARGTTLMEQALSARPSMNRARVLMARLRLDAKNIDAAKKELERVLSTAPDHAEAKRMLATIAPSTPARDAPEKKVEDVPVKQATADAGPQGIDGGEDPPEQQYESLMREGDRHRERERTRRALVSYEKAAALRPTSAEPLAGMGWCYIDLEKPETALAMFKRATASNERYAEAYFGQAEAHRLLGHKLEAIAMYETYVTRAPDGPDKEAARRTLDELKK